MMATNLTLSLSLSLAANYCSGLRRTGKSCRLRWLNYLRPDVRRGNITPEEQLLILQLHSRWGNRWSKIAQYLPGRTDNEIKNYWRTRVQKHAKQLRCDVNSKQFKDAMTYVWMPRLVERIRAASGVSTTAPVCPAAEVELVMKPSPEESSTPSSSFGAEFPPPPPAFDTFAAAAATQSGEGELPGWWSESGDTDLGLPDFDHSVWGDDLWIPPSVVGLSKSGGEEGPPTRTNRLAAVSDVRQRRGARPRRSNYGLYAHMVVNRGVLFPRA
ncbi:hypothetical protein GW17_00023239 [Ensete ventricosum]|nr:hypothetical protein GW17_00023239 [Ensete ventricosum]